MRIVTGPGARLEPAMIDALRQAMRAGGESRDLIVVVPRQLTLQTERTLLAALGLKGSFALRVLSPERLCGRIFEAAGQPEGVRVDDRGRVMLVRRALEAVNGELSLYRDAVHRRGFAERCARQLETVRQAGLSPRALMSCAGRTQGVLAMKLQDLSRILGAYEAGIDGRFQDGESEFRAASALAGGADFLKEARVSFFGFDMAPPTLHGLMAAVAAACPETDVYLPLEGDPAARDYDVYLPLEGCLARLIRAAEQAGVRAERVCLEGAETDDRDEIVHLARELYAYPPRPWPVEDPPRRVQLATLKNPLEECLFAAALCRRLAMKRGWRWSDMLILCRDIEDYHQSLKEAFEAYGVPLFLSSSRPASRHALAECLLSALRLCSDAPSLEDALSMMRTGFMPITQDEADRLANHAVKYGLKARQLLRPLRRGLAAEIEALEDVRARMAAPVNALRDRLRRAGTLKAQLTALFGFLTDIGACGALEARLNRLAAADLRQQAGEESQVWNRLIGALDQMAELMGEAPMSVRDLIETLTGSLEAAVIKPLPQSGDAVYAQPTDRIMAQKARALLILGETDRSGGESDGLFSQEQQQALARMTNAYLGMDGAEQSRVRRFYIKSALGMASDYVMISCPLSGADDSSQRPGPLFALVRDLFPAMTVRGGVTGDAGVERMLRGAPAAALGHVARALSAGDAPLSALDAAVLAGAAKLAPGSAALSMAIERLQMATRHGESADRLDPATARALYGEIRQQSVTRLELFAQCPFAYFTQYGLKPERVQPYAVTVQDEGTFFHEAVDGFMRASMEDLDRLSDEAAEQRMDAIARRLLDIMAESGPLGASSVALAERRRLMATARTCACVLAEHMRGSRFELAAIESDFGREDGPAQLIIDASSGACTLQGRIDRVDEWLEGGFLRVIDYKRGGRELELDGVYHGLSLQLPMYLAAAMKKRNRRSAGVYYFPLDEGIIALQTTDPHEVEKQRRKLFRLSGLAPEDMTVLKALSPDFSGIMKVSVTKSGELSSTAQVTDEAGFEALISRAMDRAAAHLDGIRSGDAAVSPSEFRGRSPCTWCQWRSACLMDARMDAGCVRRFRHIKGAEVLKRLKLEGGGVVR